jgi:hypothetical protein
MREYVVPDGYENSDAELLELKRLRFDRATITVAWTEEGRRFNRERKTLE